MVYFIKDRNINIIKTKTICPLCDTIRLLRRTDTELSTKEISKLLKITRQNAAKSCKKLYERGELRKREIRHPDEPECKVVLYSN